MSACVCVCVHRMLAPPPPTHSQLKAVRARVCVCVHAARTGAVRPTPPQPTAALTPAVPRAPPRSRARSQVPPELLTKRSRKIFRVGIFFDFASSPTRTMHPHGAYVQMGGRNRIAPHLGGIERLTTRTMRSIIRSMMLLIAFWSSSALSVNGIITSWSSAKT